MSDAKRARSRGELICHSTNLSEIDTNKNFVNYSDWGEKEETKTKRKKRGQIKFKNWSRGLEDWTVVKKVERGEKQRIKSK